VSGVSLRELNVADRQRFVSVCGPLFEGSPWIAERAWPLRPFSSLRAVHQALVSTMEAASPEDKLALIRAHPDLVGRLAQEAGAPAAAAPALGALSAGEQAAAGLTSLSAQEADRFRAYNREYYGRFGFPFVICARENRREAILRAFPERLRHSRDEEISTALSEIARIAWLRLQDAVVEA